MRLVPARRIDHRRENTGGYSVPTVRLALLVGVDSPPDDLVNENKSFSYCLSCHLSHFGQAYLALACYVFTMVQASICLLAIGAS